MRGLQQRHTLGPVATEAGSRKRIRRLVRHHRELAKANSSQSLRVRDLESEKKRLLSDNLELREKTFRVESELWQGERRLTDILKEELQARLADLINGLANVAAPQESPHDRPPLAGRRRERQPLIKPMRKTAMPTISEDEF
ncbi:Shugoshin C terminus [Teratosphaeria destructans]|uniref:Shugoshin C terminus n=1 Tax=Teratosphaeria destructans TaxID=418781 RepID=A0A9W7SQZ4_9PEZI|nr:Shugoshin C terminus [Teratosphaeria destructans]